MGELKIIIIFFILSANSHLRSWGGSFIWTKAVYFPGRVTFIAGTIEHWGARYFVQGYLRIHSSSGQINTFLEDCYTIRGHFPQH